MAIMAVADINNNPNILPGHKLMLDIQDGQCEADIVMKKFIDFIKNKDPSRFRRTVGILGESIPSDCTAADRSNLLKLSSDYLPTTFI